MDDDFAKTVAALADAEDLAGLQALVDTAVTPEQKTLLAEDGFLVLAGVIRYDIACSKGFEGAADVALSCVETAEALLGRPLWIDKGDALATRLDEGDVASGQRAIEAFLQASSVPHQRLAQVHAVLATHVDPLAHWSEALRLAEAASPRRWDFYLALLYEPIAAEPPALTACRVEAIARFEATEPTGSFDDVEIAKAYRRFKRPTQSAKWLERATQWDFRAAPEEQLRTAGHFFAKTALDRAIAVYAHLLERTPVPGLEVYYLADVLERRGRVDEALRTYERHAAAFVDSLSPMIHYAEFLERIGAPRANVEAVARRAAQLGKGHYAGPGLALARVAIKAGDAATARFELTRLLLLHELCIEERIEALRNEVTLPEVRAFLDDTCDFMRSVRPGYFYDPKIRWPELEPLSRDEVDARWAARKLQIAEAQLRATR